MSESSMTLDNTFKAAAEKGLVVRVPNDNELFLDIDSRADFEHFQKTIASLPNVTGWVRSPSKSGYPKCHVVVTLNKIVSSEERILLQACLGSDRLHEMLCYLAKCQGNPTPSVFFERH